MVAQSRLQARMWVVPYNSMRVVFTFFAVRKFLPACTAAPLEKRQGALAAAPAIFALKVYRATHNMYPTTPDELALPYAVKRNSGGRS